MDNFLRLTVRSTRYMIAWWDTLASRNYQIPCIIAHPCMSISGHLHFARRLHTLPTSGFVHCACPIFIVHLISYSLHHTWLKTDPSSPPGFIWQPCQFIMATKFSPTECFGHLSLMRFYSWCSFVSKNIVLDHHKYHKYNETIISHITTSFTCFWKQISKSNKT